VDGTKVVNELSDRVEHNEFALTKALGQIVDIVKSHGA